jgi:acyl-CoA reductase-like NAD-dependent aldehyde dehydrogenase
MGQKSDEDSLKNAAKSSEKTLENQTEITAKTGEKIAENAQEIDAKTSENSGEKIRQDKQEIVPINENSWLEGIERSAGR